MLTVINNVISAAKPCRDDTEGSSTVRGAFCNEMNRQSDPRVTPGRDSTNHSSNQKRTEIPYPLVCFALAEGWYYGKSLKS